MSYFVISQILVGCALITDVASFQFKQRKYVLGCLVGSCCLIAIHFLLLNRYTAATIVTVTGVRFLTSIFTQRRSVMWAFYLANLGCFVVTYESWISCLPFVAAQLSTWAGFQSSDKTLRIVFASSTCLWITHNIIVWTPVGVLLEILFLASNIIGLYRHYYKSSARGMRTLKQVPL